MKIFEINTELDGFNLLYTQRPLLLLKEIQQKNKKALIVTPFTKYSDILNFSKDNPLINLIVEIDGNFREKLIDITYLKQIVEKINKGLEIDIVEEKMELEKFTKLFFEVNGEYIKEGDLEKILNFYNKYCSKKTTVVIAGFKIEYKVYENLEVLAFISSLQNNNLNFSNLEIVKFDNLNNNSVFSVEDIEAFIKWIELETKSAITREILSEYFEGKDTFHSFLIERAIKKISHFFI